MRFARLVDRPRDTRQSSLVKNDINTVYCAPQSVVIVQVPFDKFEVAGNLFQIFAIAGYEVIYYPNFRPLPNQFVREVRTNKAGTAGNESTSCYGHINQATAFSWKAAAPLSSDPDILEPKFPHVGRFVGISKICDFRSL